MPLNIIFEKLFCHHFLRVYTLLLSWIHIRKRGAFLCESKERTRKVQNAAFELSKSLRDVKSALYLKGEGRDRAWKYLVSAKGRGEPTLGVLFERVTCARSHYGKSLYHHSRTLGCHHEEHFFQWLLCFISLGFQKSIHLTNSKHCFPTTHHPVPSIHMSSGVSTVANRHVLLSTGRTSHHQSFFVVYLCEHLLSTWCGGGVVVGSVGLLRGNSDPASALWSLQADGE